MIALRDVAEVRAAEEEAFRRVPAGTLMQRAAFALGVSCLDLIRDARGSVVGARVVLLVGSGDNGGDALWAGAMLARRGCRVDAVCVSDRRHAAGSTALERAGGRLHRWGASDSAIRSLIGSADLVVDGILGIGGTGGLRPEAADLVSEVAAADVPVVSVDLPSGVDADTGEVSGAAVVAHLTVTFGALKPGLVLAPGRYHAGTVTLADIALAFTDEPSARILEGSDVAAWVAEPGASAYKYRRGVVGMAAGSRAYPGAALLAASAARHVGVGMTRYLDRMDGTAPTVVGAFPDVVVDGSAPAEQSRVTAWGCGSGFPGDHTDELTVAAILDAPVPVVLDAGALSVVAGSTQVRGRIHARAVAGLPTVLTPHDGEFERLLPGLLASSAGRLAAARAAAQTLGAVIVLKGPGTVVAAPSGTACVDTEGTAALATAGSGDVLMGLVAALLSGAWADGRRGEAAVVEATAAAVWLHGRAGRIADRSGPVSATDVARAIPAAVLAARFGVDG